MHVQSVTFISEYNQTYHTSHLVIIVYILLCVIGAQLKWISTTQTVSPVKYFSKYFHRNSKLKKNQRTNQQITQQNKFILVQQRQYKHKTNSTNHPSEQVQSCSTEAKQTSKHYTTSQNFVSYFKH